nr:insulinase family protein [Cyclobacteriaceae bacterium]
LKLRPLAYTQHPYQWATIGKEISHIENATMDDVREFFYQHYRPNNATLVVAGNVTTAQVKTLAEKWFGSIPSGSHVKKQLPQEPKQKEKRIQTVHAKVPANALYMAWHMPGRFDFSYYAYDLLSDVLSRGKASRLYNMLVKEKELFSSISSFVTGTIDPGLFVISGRLKDGVNPEQAENEVHALLATLIDKGISDEELAKVKNQALATLAFGEVEVMNRAMNLAFANLSGNPDLVNHEPQLIANVTAQEIKQVAAQSLTENKCTVLYYKKENETV